MRGIIRMSDHKVQQAPGTGKRRRHRGGNRRRLDDRQRAGACRAARERAPWEPPVQMRLAPREELVNILEFEEEAKKKLQPATFALIAGGDRALFDRITLRPRMNIPTTDMDLSVTPVRRGSLHADHRRADRRSEALPSRRRARDGKRRRRGEGADDRQQPLERAARRHCRGREAVVLVSGLRVRLAPRRRRCRTRSRPGAKAIVITVGASHAANGARPATADLDQLVRRRCDQAGCQRSCDREGHHDAGRSDGGAAAQRAGHHRVELRRAAREQGRDDSRAARTSSMRSAARCRC